MRHLPLSLFSLAIVAAACAPKKLPTPSPEDPAAREAVFLTAHDLAPGRECRVIDGEVPLPDVATLIDTAAMPDLIRQAGIAAASGYALFSIRHDSAGGPVRARLIESTLVDSVAAQLRLAVASALLPRAPGHRLAARLRVDLAPAPTYRLGRSEYCDPQRITAKRGRGSSLNPNAPAASPVYRSATRIEYRVDVAASGQVLAVTFLTPLNEELANDMRTTMMLGRWLPALDDGVPVGSQLVVSDMIRSQSNNPRATITQ
jgi:hypothetical protein